MLPSQFFKRCFDTVRNVPIKMDHVIATGAAGIMSVVSTYATNKDRGIDLSNRDIIFENDGYRPINDDPRAKPVIDTILKQYAPHESDIRVYERIESGYPYWESTGCPDILSGASANSSYKSIWVDNKYISDAIRDRDDVYYQTTEATIGHEIGHIVNQSMQKRRLINGCITFGAVAGFMNYSVRAFNKIRMPWRSYLSAYAIYGSVIGISSKFLNLTYSRYDERRADHYMIKHVKNPYVLEEQAFAFKEDEKNDTRSFLEKRLWSTHPSSAERAAYFEKAAQELEEKIARESKK